MTDTEANYRAGRPGRLARVFGEMNMRIIIDLRWSVVAAVLLLPAAFPALAQDAPACPLPGSPCNPGDGANQSNVNGATGAGNPIDVTSGNKYTVETDVAWDGDLALMFHRHYNSSAGTSRELGLGWSLGLVTGLQRDQRGANFATIRVHQGDGREIEFVASGAVRDGVVEYVSHPSGYGVIEEKTADIERLRRRIRNAVGEVDEDPERLRPWTWRWLDGKRVEFDGKGLARRIARTGGGALELRHDAQGRLVNVRDLTGRVLALKYFDDATELLSNFDPKGKPPVRAAGARGRLKSLTLPDGAVIAYGYDNAGLLAEVLYPDGTAARYEYELAAGQPRLVRIYGRDTRLTAEYAYDAGGRAVSTRSSNDMNRVDVEYRLAARRGALNETWVRSGLGAVSVYRWRLAKTGPQLVEALGPGCANCAPTNERYAYDRDGRVTRVERLSETDPRARRAPRVLAAIDTQYDAYGRVREINHSEGGLAQLIERRSYADGAFTPGPTLIERPSIAPGHLQSMAVRYDARGLPQSIVESGFSPQVAQGRSLFTPLRRETTLGYTPGGLIAWVDGPEHGTADRVTFEYSADQQIAAVRYPEGVRETFGYDALGRLKARRAQDGVSWAYRYPASARRYLTAPQPFVVAKATLVSVFSFAPTGALAIYRAPQGDVYHLARDAAGNLVSIADQRGFRVDYRYDIEGNRVAENWRARTATHTAQRSVNVGFDAYRRVSSYSAHPSESVAFEYDDAGSLRAVNDPASERLRVIAESDGRIQQLLRETPDGAQALGAFSLAGEPALDVGSLPRDQDEAAVSTPDVPHAGTQLVALARRAVGGDWSSLWPAHATRFEAFEGPNGDAHGVIYDDFGRVVHSFSDDAGADEYTYGAGPDPLTHCRANGNCERTDYDALGRPRMLTAVSATGEQRITRLAYSGLLLASLSNEQQTTRYRYDAAGRLVERIDSLPVGKYRYAWSFDARGRLIEQSLPDGSRLVPRYNGDDSRPEAIDLTDPDGRTRVLLDDIQHNAIESFTSFRYGNGVAKRLSFDSHGRLLTVDLGVAPRTEGSLLASVIPAAHGASASHHPWSSALSFDELGRLTGVERGGQLLSVRTDVDGRLIELGSEPDAERFSYDAGGNLLERHAGTARHAFEYAASSNRLARVDTSPVEHDASGNVTRFANLRIGYGPDNRPQRVDLATGQRVSYAYNALGERVKRTVSVGSGATDAWFLYGDQRLEAELDAQGRVTGMYVFLGDEPVARIEHAKRGGWARHAPDWMVRLMADAPRITFIHADPLGTPRYATDENQHIVWSADYDAYGSAHVDAGATTRINLRFAGQYFDDVTGLHYNYLRDYAPAAGRYLQPDPAGLPGGLNLYEYAGANPLAATDVRGTSIVSWLGKKVGMKIVQREIRHYMERFARTRIAQIIARYSQRFSKIADQFGEADEIMQILNSADGIGVWDVVGLVPVIGDAIEIGRTAKQLCRIRDLMKKLDRKLIGFGRLPATGGSWLSGVPGNGIWKLADGRSIRFINGFPDFKPFGIRLPNGQSSVRITLGASHNADMAEVARQMRRIDPNWRQPPNTIWHHDTECGVMILVDAAINAVAHSGGRALHEQGLCP